MGFGLAVQISALSWILWTKYGLKIDEVGFVWLAGPLAGIIGQLLAGVISDRIWFWGGRRRPLIIVGGIVAAGMLFLLPRLDLPAQTERQSYHENRSNNYQKHECLCHIFPLKYRCVPTKDMLHILLAFQSILLLRN